jgi:hypothetical protein
MAAPGVAAAALLVRQYFTDGYYPTGKPVPAHSYKPSAPLLRAVLVAGAAAMTGVSVVDDQPLAVPPKSQYQVR